jgi:hypothetical protein
MKGAMPDNGPDKIEQLLRQYAKQRRAQGGDFALHPATRELLLGEAKRHHRQRPEATLSAWLLWWPRLAFSLGLSVVLGLIIWQFVRTDPTLQPQSMSMVQNAPQPSPARLAPAAKDGLADKRQALPPTTAPVEALAFKADAPAPAVVSAPAAKAMIETRFSTGGKRLEEARPAAAKAKLAEVQPATPPPAPMATAPIRPQELAKDISRKSVADELEVKFEKTARSPAPTAYSREITGTEAGLPAPALAARAETPTATAARRTAAFLVLEHFALAVSNQTVRVVDADGSVYLGRLVVAAGKPAGVTANLAPKRLRSIQTAMRDQDAVGTRQDGSAQPDAPGASPPGTSATWEFNVTGTNRTTKQRVQLAGTLPSLPLTNTLLSLRATNQVERLGGALPTTTATAPEGLAFQAIGAAGALASPAASASGPAAPVFLRGQVTINGQPARPLHAVQAPR